MRSVLLATLVLGGWLAGTAHADSTTGADQGLMLEEIIVTAQKREQPLQDVPVAVTALAPDMLREQGVTNIFDLTGLAPNVEVTRIIETPSIFIRGVGSQVLASGPDSSVATHIDGVYVSRARAQVAGLYDIERLEILRGPQGDLYGRNSTGGTLNIVTHHPIDKFEAWTRIATGNYSKLDAEGAINAPLMGDKLLGRLSFISLNHSGYTRNISTGHDVDDQHEKGVRGQLLWHASSNTELLFSADYYHAGDGSGGWHVLGPGTAAPLVSTTLAGTLAPDPIREIASERDPRRALELTNIAATSTTKISDTLTFKSISGYRKSRADAYTDIDGSALALGALDRQEHGEQYSEELQLLHDTRAWHTIVGAYYLKEWLFGRSYTPVNLPSLPPGRIFNPEAHLTTEAAALFGRTEYAITDRLGLSFGGRYSWEERSVDGRVIQPNASVFINTGRKIWQDFSPRFTVSYKLQPDVLSYITASKGFKSGAYVNGVNATVSGADPSVDPEKVVAVEGGLKSEWLNHNLQLNLAAFHYQFDDLQVSRIVGTTPILDNAGKAKINGIEAEFHTLLGKTRTLSVNGSLAWLDGKYDEYTTADPSRLSLGPIDLSGNQMQTAPEWSAFLNVKKRFSLSNGAGLALSGSYRWRDNQYFDPFNQPNAFQKAYGELAARIEWVSTSGATSVALWGQNLTNEEALLSTTVSSGIYGFPRLGAVNEPRTYGLELVLRFD